MGFSSLICILSIKKKNFGRGKVGVEAPELSDELETFSKVLGCERVVVGYMNLWVKKFLIWVVGLGAA